MAQRMGIGSIWFLWCLWMKMGGDLEGSELGKLQIQRENLFILAQA